MCTGNMLKQKSANENKPDTKSHNFNWFSVHHIVSGCFFFLSFMKHGKETGRRKKSESLFPCMRYVGETSFHNWLNDIETKNAPCISTHTQTHTFSISLSLLRIHNSSTLIPLISFFQLTIRKKETSIIVRVLRFHGTKKKIWNIRSDISNTQFNFELFYFLLSFWFVFFLFDLIFVMFLFIIYLEILQFNSKFLSIFFNLIIFALPSSFGLSFFK